MEISTGGVAKSCDARGFGMAALFGEAEIVGLVFVPRHIGATIMIGAAKVRALAGTLQIVPLMLLHFPRISVTRRPHQSSAVRIHGLGVAYLRGRFGRHERAINGARAMQAAPGQVLRVAALRALRRSVSRHAHSAITSIHYLAPVDARGLAFDQCASIRQPLSLLGRELTLRVLDDAAVARLLGGRWEGSGRRRRIVHLGDFITMTWFPFTSNTAICA